MKYREDEVEGRTEDDGQGRAPLHPRATPDGQRRGENGQSPEAAGSMPDVRGSAVRRDASSWVSWQSALYVFVLGTVSLVLAPLTSLWWIVPVLGALMPIVLAVLDGPGPKLRRTDDKKSKERELLNALAERGEITLTTAAMHTSLTVDEASKMLDELTGKGHLKLQTEDGVMAYALPERDRRPRQNGPSELSEPGPEEIGAPEPLDEPLSERELELLTLLASGKTNAEIARDLYVAVGTVKSHINNIYRKLNARNRAEAVTRARENNLLH